MGWDDFMRATRGGGGFSGNFGGVDLGDIFGDIFGFGGRSRGNRKARGRDIQVDVEIDFKDAVYGTEKQIHLAKHNACNDCNGSGGQPGSGTETCKECNGQGQVMRVQRTILGAMQTASACTSCSGRGQIIKEKCKKCNGHGALRENTEISIKIPAGIDDGQSIRLSGKGEYPGQGGVAGDLYVQIHVKADKKFKRDGYDILSETTISYPQAVLGDQIKIQTVDGEKTLVIPAGTQSHQKFRLKDLGVTHLNGSSRGSQYITVVVDVPKKVNKKTRKLIEELKKEI